MHGPPPQSSLIPRPTLTGNLTCHFPPCTPKLPQKANKQKPSQAVPPPLPFTFLKPKDRTTNQSLPATCRPNALSGNFHIPPSAGHEKLVRQVALATQKAGVPLAGENALPRYDDYAHEQILQASALNIEGNTEGKQMCAFTYLRMNPQLFQADNWRRFVSFVKKMKEGKNTQKCREQVEREAEHFVHVTTPLVQEAAVALTH